MRIEVHVHGNTAPAVAWVESPLQLLCAVEFAAASGLAVDIVARAGGLQLAETATRLREIGLPHGVTITSRTGAAFLALALVRSRHWVVGDAFSGLVRAALAVRIPRALTILDDGSTSLQLPAVMANDAPLARPGIEPTVLHDRARARLARLGREGRLDFFSMYELDVERITPNGFDWLRSRGLKPQVEREVILGSAAVVDGISGLDSYLDWIRAQSRPATYFPHRRETEALVRAVSKNEGVFIYNAGLPIELVLAGAEFLQIRSLASSATRSLGIILEGSGSVITTETLAETRVHS